MYRFHHWRVQIQDAHDERGVARVMQDYRLTLSPAMVESLPAPCQEAIKDRDIPGAALTLLQEDVRYRGGPEVAAVLHEVAKTYAAAAVKIAAWKARR